MKKGHCFIPTNGKKLTAKCLCIKLYSEHQKIFNCKVRFTFAVFK